MRIIEILFILGLGLIPGVVIMAFFLGHGYTPAV